MTLGPRVGGLAAGASRIRTCGPTLSEPAVLNRPLAMNVLFSLGWRSAWTGPDDSTAKISADLCGDRRRLRRFRLFGQLPGRNKLKGPGSRLLVSFFPEIKFILSCCGVL